MILGIGVDIVSIPRMMHLLKRFGDAFAKRILEEKEYGAYKQIKARDTQAACFLAKHFAAKEAAVKALGTGFSKDVRYHDVSVTHTEEGQPCLQISPHILERSPGLRTHLSLSDEAEVVIAFVVMEKVHL